MENLIYIVVEFDATSRVNCGVYMTLEAAQHELKGLQAMHRYVGFWEIEVWELDSNRRRTDLESP